MSPARLRSLVIVAVVLAGLVAGGCGLLNGLTDGAVRSPLANEGEAGGCDVDDDCAGALACFDGLCGCDRDEQCPAGLLCFDIDHSCVECVGDIDCSGGGVCESGDCVPGEGEGEGTDGGEGGEGEGEGKGEGEGEGEGEGGEGGEGGGAEGFCDAPGVCSCSSPTDGCVCAAADECACDAEADPACTVTVADASQLGCRGPGCTHGSILGGTSCGGASCVYTCGGDVEDCVAHDINLACVKPPDTTGFICTEPHLVTATCGAAAQFTGGAQRGDGGPMLFVTGYRAAEAAAGCVTVTAAALAGVFDFDLVNGHTVRWVSDTTTAPSSSVVNLNQTGSNSRELRISFDVCDANAVVDGAFAMTVVDDGGVRSNVACRIDGG